MEFWLGLNLIAVILWCCLRPEKMITFAGYTGDMLQIFGACALRVFVKKYLFLLYTLVVPRRFFHRVRLAVLLFE